MKGVDFGKPIAILANVGVIVGIVFLALELRQNNDLLGAQARFVRHDYLVSGHLLPFSNRDFANALIKHRNGDELTEYEELLLNRSIAVTLENFQFAYAESQRGFIEESSLPVEDWANSFNGRSLSQSGHWPNMTDYWEANKHNEFDPDFVQWMEANVVNR